MLTAEVVLRIIEHLLEMQVIILQKASTEQVQAWIDRLEKRIARFERILDKVLPDVPNQKPLPDVHVDVKP